MTRGLRVLGLLVVVGIATACGVKGPPLRSAGGGDAPMPTFPEDELDPMEQEEEE